MKLNDNITGNLPIEFVPEIVSFTYKFEHQLKFEPVFQDIEDGTICVLWTLIFPMFQCGTNPVDFPIYRWWDDRMYPAYHKFKQYEGTSRYLTPYDVIRGSMQLKKYHKRCKYKTRKEIVALVERNNIILGCVRHAENWNFDGNWMSLIPWLFSS